MADFKLIHGIYESVITNALNEKLQELGENFKISCEKIDSEESVSILALHLSKLIATSLSLIKGEEKSKKQAEFCNQILKIISANNNSDVDIESEKILEDLKCLLAIQDKTKKALSRPDTPLSNGALFTGTSSDLTLETELKKEIQTSDSISILCSFIKWSGLRLLLPYLREATKDGKTLNIITTSYLGATDLKAIEELQKLQNTELYISYDTERTRLHAKSYIFHRNNGFGTAYIGSSNISAPALTSGLEWNLKISQFESPYLWKKICATFDTYLHTPEFCPYEENSHDRLANALKQERGNHLSEDYMAFMDVHPYPYQDEILDKISVERQIHNCNKHLIVAATGTGKTVIAAFDYKRILKQNPNSKFLFVAHREEILKQSRYTFRNILRDQNFGELLTGNDHPESFDCLFASIQSINTKRLCNSLSTRYYDYIVIDEFHHAAANSYQSLLEHFTPKYLIGLTATPERHDGLDVLKYFDYHITAEIRLPDAINRKLLSPFQYFGISDNVDLSNVRWINGGYDINQLNEIFCGNTLRASLVIQKMHEILLNIEKSRCLCFCVSQAHAEFMNNFFNQNGIKSSVLTANSHQDIRNSVQEELRKYKINVICVVDIYNEGVDIKEIDTVIFLRPTESLTVFLQQLGRGLRLCDDKECLTVLDFVGNAHKNFNFEYRFRAMLGTSGQNVADELKHGFPHLPAGCHIQLEKEAQNYILRNIEGSITNAKKTTLVNRIKTFEDESGKTLILKNFVDYHHLQLSTIYKHSLFERLRQIAELRNDFVLDNEDRLRKGLLRICHYNSKSQLETLHKILDSKDVYLNELSEKEKRILTMFHFSIWGLTNFNSLQESISKVKENQIFLGELLSVLDYLIEHANVISVDVKLPSENCPLELHANYTRDEILAALGYWKIGNTPDMREGVKYLNDINTDVFLITLNKSEKQYSPTTMYQDYAISNDLFHWQSQSTTSLQSPTGQRYISNNGTKLLFVRENKNINGISSPYCFLGPAVHVSHNGSRPISIIWKLQHEMPSRLCRITERMAIA